MYRPKGIAMTRPTTHSPAPKTRKFATAALLAATAALSVGPAALAQQQVQGGNALDANHQVGSGGSNRVENQVDYAQRNLVVTGQVGGGRAFQGDVDYFTAGGFQDGLGSDSLFNFQRDSVFSSPQALGVQVNNTGGQVIVTRNTTSAPGFNASVPLGRATGTVYDQRSGTVSFRQNSGALVTIPGVSDLSRFHSLGTVRTQDGSLASLNASTLTGIQVNPLQAEPFNLTPQSVTPLRATPPDFEPELDSDIVQPGITSPYLRGQQRPDGTDPDDGPDPSLLGGPTPQNSTSNNGRFAPTMMLGNEMQRDLAIQATRGTAQRRDGSLAQLNTYIFGTTPQQANPDEPAQAPVNPYEAILQEIRDQALGDMPEDGGDNAAVERPPWMDILENPDEAVLDAVNRAKDDAIRRSLGLVNDDGSVDREAELPEIDVDSELGQLIDGLDYDLPRVASLSGEDREQRQNQMLLRAEQDLSAGNYLAAENLYRQVLRESADNPLARAGLIHAQLGGGMIRSAAFNLRALFSEHPELIALRYDEALMPSGERLRWLQRELTDMIADDVHGAEPGLILAYLGYQLEADTLIQYGLGIAQERTPRDPLLPVLDRIWLEREAAE
ncbi:hypothetical protein OT109_08600 [Phycisphaeraceae bacterium D3-23]